MEKIDSKLKLTVELLCLLSILDSNCNVIFRLRARYQIHAVKLPNYFEIGSQDGAGGGTLFLVLFLSFFLINLGFPKRPMTRLLRPKPAS